MSDLTVKGCSFKINHLSGTTGGEVEVVGDVTGIVESGGKGCWFGGINITVKDVSPPNTATHGTQPAPLPGRIIASSQAVTSQNQAAVLKGDKSAVIAIVFPPIAPNPSPFPATITVEVDDPGQSVVECK